MPENRSISLESVMTISEDAVSRELDGEAVILELGSGTYFGLNDVGTRVWALIGERRSLRQVFDALTQEYDVSPETLERDLVELVEKLRAKGLVNVVPGQ